MPLSDTSVLTAESAALTIEAVEQWRRALRDFISEDRPNFQALARFLYCSELILAANTQVGGHVVNVHGFHTAAWNQFYAQLNFVLQNDFKPAEKGKFYTLLTTESARQVLSVWRWVEMRRDLSVFACDLSKMKNVRENLLAYRAILNHKSFNAAS